MSPLAVMVSVLPSSDFVSVTFAFSPPQAAKQENSDNNPENKPCINHKDGNKLNNDLNNLEWATISENTKHAYANKLERNWWTKELGIVCINLIENYKYNFAYSWKICKIIVIIVKNIIIFPHFSTFSQKKG